MHLRVFQIVIRGGANPLPLVGKKSKILLGGIFCWAMKTWGVIFTIYWTSIKIKISMACVYKEQWQQLKMKFFLGYNMKTAI